jgi:type I restriction enzyme S subunit
METEIENIKDDVLMRSKGFKKTKVGWIPEDWRVVTLEKAVTFLDGKRKPIKESDRSKMKGKYPYYGASGIIDYINDYIFDEELILLGEDGANILNRSTRLAFKVKGKVWVNNHAHVLKPKTGFDIDYLNDYLESIDYIKYNTSIAQPKLNKAVCQDIPIAVPNYEEQKQIAEILSTWDEAIESSKNLIENLKLRKKGLMQQLLTGKKRLSGFDGEWRKIPIGDIADHYSTKNKANDEIVVLSCTKYDGLVPSLEYFGRKVYGDDISKYKMVPKGYFAYATNHIEEGSIGLQTDLEVGLVSPMYTVFKTKKQIHDAFFFRMLKTEKMIYKYQSNMSGSIARRGGLRWNDFKTIKVYIPEFEEQKAINDIFIETDNELANHKAKLFQLETQKKGLMQQLLTGQLRVSAAKND